MAPILFRARAVAALSGAGNAEGAPPSVPMSRLDDLTPAEWALLLAAVFPAPRGAPALNPQGPGAGPQQTGGMANDALEDSKPSLVEAALMALDDAQASRIEAEWRLAFLFEPDPDRAAEIASWLP